MKKKEVTDRVLLAAFQKTYGVSVASFLATKPKDMDAITFHYVMARLQFRNGHYANALMQYSLGLPVIAKVRDEERRRKLFRRYNIDIRTELERLLHQI